MKERERKRKEETTTGAHAFPGNKLLFFRDVRFYCIPNKRNGTRGIKKPRYVFSSTRFPAVSPVTSVSVSSGIPVFHVKSAGTGSDGRLKKLEREREGHRLVRRGIRELTDVSLSIYRRMRLAADAPPFHGFARNTFLLSVVLGIICKTYVRSISREEDRHGIIYKRISWLITSRPRTFTICRLAAYRAATI